MKMKEEESLCVTFEAFDSKLSDLIAERQGKGRSFKEDELWFLADSMRKALLYL